MQRKRLTTSDPRDIAEYVDAGMDALEEKLIKHVDRRFDELADLLRGAFPEGDMTKHRLSHERQLEAEADFKSLRRSLVEKGAFGLLAAVAVINWEAIKMAVKGLFR